MSIESIKFNNFDIEKALCKDETIWSGSDDKTGSPGPKKLIGGNMEAGFFGEVPARDFITGKDLSNMLGFTNGLILYSEEPWLKFAYLGKIEFIPKKPLRNFVAWWFLSARRLVNGNKIVEIKGKRYKVRLIKGKTEGKQDDKSSCKGSINYNSEWNRLMLPIHKDAPSSWDYPENVNSPTENWNIGYTDADLMLNYKEGEGTYTWCQEYGETENLRLYKGCRGVSYSSSGLSDEDSKHQSWRPVLELVD